MATGHAIEKEVQVRVNGKQIEIGKHSTVGDVLDEAGYNSADHYLVRVEGGKDGKEFRDVTERISLHDGEEFHAYYNGQTPLS